MINRIPAPGSAGSDPSNSGSNLGIIKDGEKSLDDIVDSAYISAQDMRKASIEYYPLHVKRQKETREKTEKKVSGKKSVRGSGKISRGTVKAKAAAPMFIKDEGEKPQSLADILARETKDPVSLKSRPGKGINVGPFEKKLQAELGPRVKIQNDWDIDSLEGRIASMSEVQQIFDGLSSDKSIPYEYLPDGCYARAHVGCERFLDQGINTAKLYVMLGDLDMNNPYPFPEDRLCAGNKFTRGEWWYHVAPLTFVRDESTGEIDGFVIDPAVDAKKPMKAADWVRSMWDGNFNLKFDTTQADIYDPPAESFTDYEPCEFNRGRFDKYISTAKRTNKNYSKVLARIKEKYYQEHPDEIPM